MRVQRGSVERVHGCRPGPKPLRHPFDRERTRFGRRYLHLRRLRQASEVGLEYDLAVEHMLFATAATGFRGPLAERLAALDLGTPFAFLTTCLIVLCFGPGWLSVDGILRLFLGRETPATGSTATEAGRTTPISPSRP